MLQWTHLELGPIRTLCENMLMQFITIWLLLLWIGAEPETAKITVQQTAVTRTTCSVINIKSEELMAASCPWRAKLLQSISFGRGMETRGVSTLLIFKGVKCHRLHGFHRDTDLSSIRQIKSQCQHMLLYCPSYLYNLSAVSHCATQFPTSFLWWVHCLCGPTSWLKKCTQVSVRFFREINGICTWIENRDFVLLSKVLFMCNSFLSQDILKA